VNRKLVAWSVLVAVLIAQGYAGNYAVSSKPDPKILYHYSTAIASGVVYAVMLALVVWIAGRNGELLALVRPSTPALKTIGLTLLLFFVALVAIHAMDPFLHGGREQGLVPTKWLPRYAGAYAANWVVVAVVAPVVEELTFRGLGYSLLVARIGKTFTIVAIGLVFAASHGLLQALPELATLGWGLAWLRSRTSSVYPGMVVHSIFNSLSLAAVFF
jgi:CAAX protease family protein